MPTPILRNAPFYHYQPPNGRPPPQRKPLTDVAALALLDEATAYAALFAQHVRDLHHAA